MREEKGRIGGFDDSRLRGRIEVLGPDVSVEVLRHSVSAALVDRLGTTWDERYGELKQYKERFGNCNVPQRWAENPQLANWVSLQRSKQRRLPTERKAQLDALGFDWNVLEALWERRFVELKRYKEDPKSPFSCQMGCPWLWLGNWCSRFRFTRKMFNELERYKEKYGHCNVPIRWEPNPKLARWVSNQR